MSDKELNEVEDNTLDPELEGQPLSQETSLKERQLQRGVEELIVTVGRIINLLRVEGTEGEKIQLDVLLEDTQNCLRRIRGQKVVRSYTKKAAKSRDISKSPWFKETVD